VLPRQQSLERNDKRKKNSDCESPHAVACATARAAHVNCAWLPFTPTTRLSPVQVIQGLELKVWDEHQ
jgi:hypothetical protein